MRRMSMRRFGLRGALPLCVAAVLAAAVSHADAGELSLSLKFDAGDLSIERSGQYDVVRLPGTDRTSEEGRPELPARIVRLALPSGTVASSVDSDVDERTALEGLYRVRPLQPEVPLSRLEPARWIDPDPAVYGTASPYPSSPCVLLDTGFAAGQPIATVAVYPVQYVPTEGRLLVNESLTITLTFADATERPRLPGARSRRALAAQAERVRAVVENRESIALSAGPLRGDRDTSAEYLIVTSESYAPLFEPLAQWKSQKGVPATIITTTDIYASYPGIDNQEKIRNAVIDNYENHGTTWVLLGGDTNIVPDRRAWAKSGDSGDDLRADLYYADLDGTWNDDGDSRWGEVNADNIDMYADVFVGRAPASTTSEVTTFVGKVLTYEGAPGGALLPTDYEEKMLFMAEVLWSTPWTDGGVCKDMIDDDSVPEQFDPITKLYQTNGLLTKSRAVSEMNAGHNVINHMGHANWNVMSIGGSSLYRNDFDGLSNDPRYGIMYSIGCWAAAIDYDCMAEHWVNAPNGGGVAFIGNSRYGWGSPGNPGYGTSDVFDREFFNQLFNEGHDHLGVVHAAHRDAKVGEARTAEYTRYCLYELNLLGDPEMRVWKRNPITPVVNHLDQVPLGESVVAVTVSRDGNPVGGATVFLLNDEVSVVQETSDDGIALLPVTTSAEGSLSLTVTGQGILPYATDLSVVDAPADEDPPTQVQPLVVSDPFDTGGVIELDWSGYASPADFAFYRVYRAPSPFSDVSGMDPLVQGILDPDEKAWSDGGVQDGVPYYYAVTAVDLSGNELAVVTAAGPVAATNNARILLWDADDGDLPFDGVGDDYTPEDGTEVPWIEALASVGELFTVSQTLPDDLSPFDLIVYLGGIVNFGDGCLNVPLTDDEAVALTAFLDAGGSVYVEEPNFGGRYASGTPATAELWSRFHAVYGPGTTRDVGNVAALDGVAASLTDGISFGYDYQGWPDQFVNTVSPNGDAGSSTLWTDQSTADRGARYEDGSSGSHRYMVPVLLGGMSNGAYPSTRVEYVTRLLADNDLVGTAGVEDGIVGETNRLDQNTPNPFNPVTSIRFAVGREGARVRMAVYDVAGRFVTNLVEGPITAGEHVARWNGTDAGGRPVASGVYFVRLSVDGWTGTRKMALLR
jgi:hypothetical protein